MKPENIAAHINGTDRDGNLYRMVGSHVTLKLRAFGRRPARNIGEVEWYNPGRSDRPPGLLYKKFVKRENLYREGNAWGVCDHVLKRCKYLMIIDDGGWVYKITEAAARDAGFYLKHKNQGFELQFYVPLSAFYIVKPEQS